MGTPAVLGDRIYGSGWPNARSQRIPSSMNRSHDGTTPPAGVLCHGSISRPAWPGLRPGRGSGFGQGEGGPDGLVVGVGDRGRAEVGGADARVGEEMVDRDR